MAEAATKQRNPAAPRPVRCIVKLGGAAITNKGKLESIDEGSLRSACAQLRQAMSDDAAPEKVVGMDWSRRPGDPADPVVDVERFAHMTALGVDTNFVVVHGAGSFGHFQASRSGVHKGGLQSTLVKAGFVATRISVTSLNQEVVRAMAREGIPSIGMSPFACGWSTQQRNLVSANASQIIQSLHAGFVPVLHGDGVLDEILDCTILSGDVIIRYLAQLLSPKYVVFLTDVHGVYDRPPSDPNAVLLREIEVDDNGGWAVVKPVLQGNRKGVIPEVAEATTIRRALEVVGSHGFSNLLVESDCLTVIQKIQTTTKDRSQVGLLVGDIKNLSRGLISVSFRHIGRNLNKWAHLLARSSRLGSCNIYIQCVPECLRHELCNDVI